MSNERPMAIVGAGEAGAAAAIAMREGGWQGPVVLIVERIAYDRLLLATGARPRQLSVPVGEGSTIATLRTYENAVGIRQAIAQDGMWW